MGYGFVRIEGFSKPQSHFKRRMWHSCWAVLRSFFGQTATKHGARVGEVVGTHCG